MPRYDRSAGFTYLGLMLLIAIAGIGMAAIGVGWHTEMQREKEKELLFIGDQFRQAINSYYESTPSGVKQYPLTLDELVHDNRSPQVKHHLRRIYTDPMTGHAEWGLEKQEGRIVGVYSLSEQRPLKMAGFPAADNDFAGASKYSAWRFLAPVTQIANSAGAVSQQLSSVDQSANASSKTDANTNTNSSKPLVADDARKEACESQRVIDAEACIVFCDEKGAGMSCSRCQTSILIRLTACLRGANIPPLSNP